MINALIINYPWFMYLVVGLFSLAVGSLLNVIIYRLPIILQEEWKEQCCELFQLEQRKEK
ncbi:hypothetical protein ULM_15770 [Legionella pneumophila]|nr:hypothetical protein ULM_15770 [Legionella pneumophila]